jgi:hypothetical protein
MTQNVWFIAAIWMALALSASLISIWAGISVALVEILVGVIAEIFLEFTRRPIGSIFSRCLAAAC